MRHTTKHKAFMAGNITAKYFNTHNKNDNTKAKNFFILDVFGRMQRLNKKHHLLCEFACNGFEDEADDKLNESSIRRLETLFKGEVELLSLQFLKNPQHTLKAEFQHDPRGLTCKVILVESEQKANYEQRELSGLYLMDW